MMFFEEIRIDLDLIKRFENYDKLNNDEIVCLMGLIELVKNDRAWEYVIQDGNYILVRESKILKTSGFNKLPIDKAYKVLKSLLQKDIIDYSQVIIGKNIKGIAFRFTQNVVDSIIEEIDDRNVFNDIMFDDEDDDYDEDEMFRALQN